ncbi:MAG TPA: DUF2017 family protein [Chthoniobacteraceae bacterium]|jgi:hypothetical protein|nr:DUF2017 family protein [Chthoniobacteraceae bacterium]
MQLARIDPLTIALTQLDPFVCDLLRQIVPSASPGDHPAAHARLYSSPSAGAEPELDADWREFVEPDLREHFEASRSLVERDLATLQPAGPGEEDSSLHIPVAHLDSWINAMNQARLTLAEKHGITEQDMRRELTLGDARSFALFQIEFYGELQFCFIREVERKV